MVKFKSQSSDQMFLLPPTLDDLVPQDALARVVSEVVEELDLTLLYHKYSLDGRPAYHPKMMLKVLFYAYANGIRSSRKIEQRLQQDTHFMYLAGMETPDHRTISDFRKHNIDLLKALFKQIVLLCVELGMVSVGHIAIDGSKIKASASKKQSKDADSLQQEIEKLEQEISAVFTEAEQIDQAEDQQFGKEQRGDELPDEIQDKVKRLQRLKQAKQLLEQRGWNKINLTDNDGCFMQMPAKLEVCYNAQAAVDSDHQVIIANDVVTEANDQRQFVPMYEQAVDNVNKTPDEVSADCGYANHLNYKYMQLHVKDAYVPPAQKSYKNQSADQTAPNDYTKDKFSYDAENDLYRCPEGHQLSYFYTKAEHDISMRIYRSNDCSNCPAHELCFRQCNKSKQRTLKIYETDGYINQIRQKLKTDFGKQKYCKRLATVEPTFGNMKFNLGFDHFLLRGHNKVRGEFDLMCIAHNLNKIHTYKLAKAA